MELHQLRYFVAVAQSGNFSREAELILLGEVYGLGEQPASLQVPWQKPFAPVFWAAIGVFFLS